MASIALFGASGRTGRHVLNQALDAGYQVRALARRPASIEATSRDLTIVEGDVLDADVVARVIENTDAVISVFGQVKGSPATVQTEGTRNIVRAADAHAVRRLVSLSGGGLPAPEHDRPKLPDHVIRFLLRRLAPQVLADAAWHLRVLQESGLDWTVVRGPVLTDSPRTGTYRVGWVGVNAGTRIGRADLAEFILGQVEDDRFIRELPFVSY